MYTLFENRTEAGRKLAEKLERYRDTNTIVLAIPRGGVSLGYEIARVLDLPLDVVLSKKIGHPLSPEYAIGSVSLDSVIVEEHPGVSETYIEDEIARIRKVLEEKRTLYEGKHHALELKGKQVIIVDDGIATGHTLMATVQLLRKSGVSYVIAATPVIPLSRVTDIRKAVDELVYLSAPADFPGVGIFYREFTQATDEEVILKLELNRIEQENKNISHV